MTKWTYAMLALATITLALAFANLAWYFFAGHHAYSLLVAAFCGAAAWFNLRMTP